jgi:hypothetical protein
MLSTSPSSGKDSKKHIAVDITLPYAVVVEEPRQDTPAADIRWSASADDWFEPVPAIDFTYRSGRDAGQYSILESVGGGVALLDFDGDGDLDLVFAGGGTISSNGVSGHRLAAFRNDANWRFVDVTSEIGLDAVLESSPAGKAWA